MKKIIYQQDEKDCGVACIAMILKHYKTEIPIHKLRELSGTDLTGTSAFGLKKTFEKLGFHSPAIQADNDVWKEKDLPLPLIQKEKKRSVLEILVYRNQQFINGGIAKTKM